MPRPAAPIMPTKRQIEEAFATAKALCPGVRIARVGPEGVTFDYPKDHGPAESDWIGKPFSSEAT